MGTEVDCKSSFEGYYSMRDVNEDSNGSSWPLFYGENSKGLTLTNNGQYYNGFIPRTVVGCNKDALKQKMLEHEAVFKNQVYELHRLYRRQRDMMEEIKRKEYHKHRISIDTSSSSSLLPSQKPYQDSHKWQIPSLPLSKPSIFGAEISNSPLSCSKGITNNNIINNNNSLKDCEIMECRPSKVRKKLFDLELPPDENMEQVSEESSYKDTSHGLADLNEPVVSEETTGHGSQFLGPTREIFEKSQNGRPGFNGFLLEGKGNGRDWLSNIRETGNYPENSTRIQDQARFNQPRLPFPATCTNNSYPYMNSTDFGNYWGKFNGSLTQKLTSFQKQQSHTVFGDKWRTNGCYTPNGFYHGSSSGSKDPSQKIIKGSNFIDLTDTTKGIDLNNDGNYARKCDQTALPWVRDKPIICKNDSRCDRVENGKILGFPVFGNSCVSKNDESSLMSTSASLQFPENGKINKGFDINVAWDDSANVEKETDTEIEKIKNNFDLNSCLTEDEELIVVQESVKKITMEIDLEAPAVAELEEEETVNEIKKFDDFNDEALAKVAAEAIVALPGQQDQVGSTSEVAVDRSDDNSSEGLLWLVDIIENTGLVSNELDEFEELTLQLEETKQEDYMPKPLALDFREPEEIRLGAGPGRPRRGQARRGRPRRDFQRDILPGLVSLSRHEVTEDLQIFGGLMKATGHSWNVGLARKNGTRGRRKSVAAAVVESPPAATPPPLPPPPPPVVVVGLDERSLTGWGKTTRRPRRQRSGSGSSVAVSLT